MSFFQTGRNAIRPQAPVIRTVAIKSTQSAASVKPSLPPSKQSNSGIVQRHAILHSGQGPKRSLKAASGYVQQSAIPQRVASTKRKRASPAPPRLEDNSEGSDNEDLLESRKRTKTSVSAEPDMDRRVRSLKAFSDEDGGVFTMLHAADIASLESKLSKYREHALGDAPGQPQLLLQYPSASQQERYVLRARFLLLRLILRSGTN
jgi:H3 lysine-79-specific histone-lysine N-methyltransferase